MLKFPCLVLDHDDTVVRSTPTIHYPAFVKTLQALRPDVHWTLEQFIAYNFDPGFEAMCRDILHFTPREMEQQEAGWRAWSAAHVPPAFDGMEQFLGRYRRQRGLVCVASHSSEETIRRDYRQHFGFEPDLVFGWELGADKRKPAPWPLEQIMARFSLEPRQLLMVDDLKPGWQMAKSCGVPFAFAGWGCEVEGIRSFMQKNADLFLQDVAELEALVLAE